MFSIFTYVVVIAAILLNSLASIGYFKRFAEDRRIRYLLIGIFGIVTVIIMSIGFYFMIA